jgi:hypothetical protein
MSIVNISCLYKFSAFHCGDYEECSLQGYKNLVRTLQKAQYVTATEPSQLMLCRFEVLAAVTMKSTVFWDVKTQFLLHREHITSPLQSPAG